MIQDIKPNIFYGQFSLSIPKYDDVVFIFRNNTMLVKNTDNGELNFLTYDKLMHISGNNRYKFKFLFRINETGYFELEYDEIATVQIMKYGFEFIKINDMRELKPKVNIFAGASSWHLHKWYASHKFCGRCGTELDPDVKERMMECPECEEKYYPRINPAVIVGLKNGNKLMMTKYAGREYKKYALIAGFTEFGETIEETVAREVMEEVGIKVKNITYYKSQPWGFDSDLLLGFFCDADGDCTINMDEAELATAEWIDYKDIPKSDTGLSLTSEMISEFIRQREAR